MTNLSTVSKALGLAFLLISCSSASIAKDKLQPVLGWDRQLFPSYLIATATIKPDAHASDNAIDNSIGDPNGLLGMVVIASQDNEDVSVTIRCPEFMEESVLTCKLAKQGETYHVMPKIRYRFDRLSRCKQATPATITFSVQRGKSQPEILSETITFRPISDCPLALRNGQESVDLSFTFAAYVNEQHPFVDKLLREALDLGVVDRFTGYQSNSQEEVIRQVYSLWDLMVARDVRYSSITTTAADSHDVASQNVRLIEDSVNNTQANCVDGSVLFVSLLRKVGIEARLVLVPGHCFVAFAADASGKTIYGLETTLVDAEADLPDEVPEVFENSVDEEYQDNPSWASFLAAVDYGTEALEKGSKKQSRKPGTFQLIDIASARKIGVLPIPFTSDEVFVSFDHSTYLESNEDEDQKE